ncbi:MAG: PIN domain-containing protein [Alphaproteobacteria bacterium]|nr:PIN domain-containing protein [Alphaproteobacteria bacterium]
MIVDTSVLVALVRREPEENDFLRVLAETPRPMISSANLLEACIVIDSAKRDDLSEAFDGIVATLDLEVTAVTSLHATIAREAYRRYGKGNHPARLNFGDCIAYALAMANDDTLLFKGDDFSQTDVKPALGS